MAIADAQTRHGSVHTDTFVLQMNYSLLAVTARTGLSEAASAEAGLIQMDYLDMGPDSIAGTADDQWVSALEGNFDSTDHRFRGVAVWDGNLTLGDWGVDTVNHTVWAVLDHNSDFAVTPEPSTLALLAAGAMGLAGFVWRQRRRKRSLSLAGVPPHSCEDETDSPEDGPAILALPSRWAGAARRAA